MRVLLIIMLLFLVTGCWDRRELTEIAIVSGVAVDKDPDTGEYILTSQYLRPAAESTQTPTPDAPYVAVPTKGKTISEAMRKANREIDRKSFYAHNKIVIVSEEVAKEGMIPIIDTFQRGKEMRGYVWFAIAKDIEAREMLAIKANNISRIPANFLSNLLENAEHDATTINILEYTKKLLAAGIEPVAGVLTREETDGEPSELVKLSGGAVFKKDKLVGLLNEKETRGYNWITGEGSYSKLGTISLPSLLEKDKLVTVLLENVNKKITPEVGKGDPLSFMINVELEARIIGQQATYGQQNRKEITDYIKKVEEEAQKQIEAEITQVIDKAQQDYQSDIFGFGEELHKHFPSEWKKVKDDWAATFAEVPYSVKAKINITNTGLLKSPLKPQE